MALDIIGRANWLDILSVTIIFLITCIATRKGTFVELFKFLGVVLGVYLSLHYYAKLSDFFGALTKSKVVPIEFWDFLSFIILAILGYLALILLRESLVRFIKVEVITLVDRWGAAILGLARGMLVVSLIIYLSSLPVLGYLNKSVSGSLTGRYFLQVSTAVYQTIWDGIMSKFMPNEKFNEAVLETQEKYLK